MTSQVRFLTGINFTTFKTHLVYSVNKVNMKLANKVSYNFWVNFLGNLDFYIPILF